MTPLSVEPIALPQNLRERVEEALARAITSGEMPQGELYSAPVLAARFGVSATPVREAMLNLEKRGFIETIRNKGFRVATVSDEDMHQLVDVRLMLEPPAMRKLAGNIPRERIQGLRELAHEIVSSAERGDLDNYLAADATFHSELTALLGNARLTALVADLRVQTRLPGLAQLLATEELSASAREHDELLDLLISGDGAKAENLMKRHISHVIGWWAGRPERDGLVR